MSSTSQHPTPPPPKKHPLNEKVYFEAVGNILKKFVDRSGCAESRAPSTTTLESEFIKELQALGIDLSLVRRWISWTCQLAECFYPNHPLNIKVLISLCTITIFHIDDVLFNDLTMMMSFHSNLLTGKHQADPLLQCLVDVILPRMWQHFEPMAATAVSVGLYDFISGTAMEYIGRNTACSPSAPDYPEYVRNKTGVAAPYAFWTFYLPDQPADLSAYIQAIPDVCAFINRANDILSFYKEELAGDEDNYIHARAKLAGINPLAALEVVCDETIELLERISKTLRSGGNPHCIEAFRLFAAGYIDFHVIATRYRLKELSAFAYGDTVGI